MYYKFKVFKAGHAVFKYKLIYAFCLESAYSKISEWCDDNGYVDFEHVKEV